VTKVIPHRELRNRSSDVLRAVQAGESFEITNHGEVVALLHQPPRAAGAALSIRAATRRGGFSTLSRAQVDHDVQAALDDLRGER